VGRPPGYSRYGWCGCVRADPVALVAGRCPGAGVGMGDARDRSPMRASSDLSPAMAMRSCRVAGRCGMDGGLRHPSHEPAVHGPSFPAAAINSPMRRSLLPLPDVMRSEMRENVSDESHKMIRAHITLSARDYCVSTESVHARAQNAHDVHRDAIRVASVSRFRARADARCALRDRSRRAIAAGAWRAICARDRCASSAPGIGVRHPRAAIGTPYPRAAIGTTARSATPV
jgi:hypothetical protein